MFTPLLLLASTTLSHQEVTLLSETFNSEAAVSAWTYQECEPEWRRTGSPNGDAIRIVSEPTGPQAWSVVFGKTLDQSVQQGDLLVLEFLARTVEGEGQIAAAVEINVDPHTKSIYRSTRIGPSWRQLRFVGAADRNHQPGEWQLNFHIGHQSQVIEVADIRLLNVGSADIADWPEQLDWFQEEYDDSWLDAANARIEEHRMGDLTVIVEDSNGDPIPNARVTIEQTRHAFKFGTAIDARRYMEDSADAERYRQVIHEDFNSIVFENDLKWWARDMERSDLALQVAQQLNQRGIESRGHVLVWGSHQHMPGTENLSGEELWEAIQDRIRRDMPRYDGELYVWDVINEAANNTEVWEKVGWDKFVETFRLAREVDPDVLLAYNDFNLSQAPRDITRHNRVIELVNMVQDAGAPIDILGDQGHLFAPFPTPDQALTIWDRLYAETGLPLEITEFDAGTFNDEVQAKVTRDYLTAAFSHPAMQGFLLWGFWENHHWRAREGGHMINADWSERPAMDVWRDLTQNVWWTDLATSTSENGDVTTRVYHGDHSITVETGGRTASLTTSVTQQGDSIVRIRL